MSRDQKPGKMRVVGNASAAPARRREDAEPGGVAETEGLVIAAAAAAAAASADRSTKLSARLVILFLAGCAVGGASLPLLGVL